MARAKARGPAKGKKAIGRPRVDDRKRAAIREAYAAGGVGLRAVAAQFGVGTETVRRCQVSQA
jgi:DNA invertase Pin-like site-specific DNA recombinase